MNLLQRCGRIKKDVIIIKECSICKEVKELSEYYFQERVKKSTGEKYTYYQPYCKECTKRKSINWTVNNPEKRKILQKKYDSKMERRINRKETNRTYRKNGKQRLWQSKNLNLLKMYANKRKIKNHQISNKEWFDCKNYFNSQCAYCGMSVEESLYIYKQDLHKEHVDHNGSNKLDNCIPACKGCNSSKHDKSFLDWYNESNPNYSKDRFDKIILWLEIDYKSHFIGDIYE